MMMLQINAAAHLYKKFENPLSFFCNYSALQIKAIDNESTFDSFL